MNPIGLATMLLTLALAAGCAPMLKTGTATRPALPSSLFPWPATLEDLMAFQDSLNRSAPADLARQYATLSAIAEQHRSDGDALKLALLLSQPGFPSRNDTAALRILQDREHRPSLDPELAPFIRWLRTSLQERARLGTSLEDMNAQLRDEKKRADTCSDKLEAIRKMEDSLIERNRH